jgi:hypothetical protein
MKVRVLTLVAFFAFGLTVCRDKKVVEAEKIVNEWIGKTIKFPDFEPITPYSNTEDTLIQTVTGDKEYKILLYIVSIIILSSTFLVIKNKNTLIGAPLQKIINLVLTIQVFNTLSDKFDGETRFKNANDIWWFCKNNLDKFGGLPIFPRF